MTKKLEANLTNVDSKDLDGLESNDSTQESHSPFDQRS